MHVCLFCLGVIALQHLFIIWSDHDNIIYGLISTLHMMYHLTDHMISTFGTGYKYVINPD